VKHRRPLNLVSSTNLCFHYAYFMYCLQVQSHVHLLQAVKRIVLRGMTKGLVWVQTFLLKMMKTWFRDRLDIVLRNFGTKLWNSFKVSVILVLLNGEVVGTSRISYKKRNFQKYCAKELTPCKQTERFFIELDFDHFSLFYILAFVLIHSFIHPSVHRFIHSNTVRPPITFSVFPKCHRPIWIPHQIYVYAFFTHLQATSQALCNVFDLSPQ